MLFPLFPLAATVTVAVDPAHPIGPISPLVYGTNEADWTANKHLALGRQGGNRLTAYNWENNASNAGSDYLNQNDAYLGGGDVPGEVPRKAVADAFAADKSMIVTIPMTSYVAADKNGGGDVNQTPNYLSVRFRQNLPAKGSAFAYPPDLNDGAVYQDEFVQWLESRFPTQTATKDILYSLDNEPDLWNSTHSRIHPNQTTYEEMVGRTTGWARAIKAVNPSAQILGFVSYGFYGYQRLQGAPDNNNRNFIDYYLDSMRAEGTGAGKRLLDVLDLHWYPEARGNGQRITGNDVSPASVQARAQAPRSLWDPSYIETSWIAQDWYGNQAIRLIPGLKAQIAAHYPGTKLSFTEYNYGAANHISGALAQADALGVFGREGVYAACYWPLQADNSFVHAAFDAFRNYDGRGGRFGDVALPATSSNVATLTAYASPDPANPDGTVLVLVNKATTNTTASVALDHDVSSARAYTLSGTVPKPVLVKRVPIEGGRAVLKLPALSVSTVVLE